MVEVLKIDKRKVSSMCADLHKSHGTTMAGLKVIVSLFHLCALISLPFRFSGLILSSCIMNVGVFKGKWPG